MSKQQSVQMTPEEYIQALAMENRLLQLKLEQIQEAEKNQKESGTK